MDDTEINQDWWTLDSSGKSINKDFERLTLSSSLDSKKGDGIIIARGNPPFKKPSSQSDSRLKISNTKISKTSPYVIPFLNDIEYNLDLSKSSGYNSSQSPTNDFSICNFSTEIKNDTTHAPVFIPNNGGFENNSPYIGNLYNDSRKRQIKNLIKIRLFSKKITKEGNDQFIFEFGDTNLIKSCRTGQVSGVQNVINQLVKDNQLILIDQRNSANETALCIATYQMNEVMIRLLNKFYASPILPLTMNNNVLHIAAAMTNDVDRRTLKYLINAINDYQPDYLIAALTAKNIFNEDVCGVLRRYQDQAVADMLVYQCLQNHIDRIEYLIEMLRNI